MRETRVWSLGWEDPLEREMATYSSILAWRMPWTEEPGGLQSMGSQRVRYDWVTSLSFYFHDVLYASLIVPDVQVDFRKGRGTRNQIVNICWINNKARESRKKICFIDYAKAFDCVDHNQLWKILKEKTIPDHLTCLLRYLYEGQEATVRTGHGPTNWFQIGKEYINTVYCHPVYLTYIQSTYEKHWAGGSTSWNQDCGEKYQQPQICRWHHLYGRKWRTKEPLDESKRRVKKSA